MGRVMFAAQFDLAVLYPLLYPLMQFLPVFNEVESSFIIKVKKRKKEIKDVPRNYVRRK